MYLIVNTQNRDLAWNEDYASWEPLHDATSFDSVDVANDAAEMLDGIAAQDYVIARAGW